MDFDNMYFDRDGQPLTTEEWVAKWASMDYRRVGFRKVRNVEVSTVWLGINYNWDPEGPPMLFETMVFGGDHDGEQWRYFTEKEAIAGHELVCKKVFGE